MSYTAVAYTRYPGYEEGTVFGPEFPSREEALRWLHSRDIGPTPVHDYLEVEPVAY